MLYIQIEKLLEINKEFLKQSTLILWVELNKGGLRKRILAERTKGLSNNINGDRPHPPINAGTN